MLAMSTYYILLGRALQSHDYVSCISCEVGEVINGLSILELGKLVTRMYLFMDWSEVEKGRRHLDLQVRNARQKPWRSITASKRPPFFLSPQARDIASEYNYRVYVIRSSTFPCLPSLCLQSSSLQGSLVRLETHEKPWGQSQ